MKRNIAVVFVLVFVLSMLMSACQPQTVVETVEVEKTVVVEKEVEVEVEKIVEVEKEVEMSAVTNAWGKAMPVDALPPEEQVLHLPCQDHNGAYLDVSKDFYNSGKSCGAVFMWERVVMLDEKANVVPGVAETWEMSDDGTSWTFHLREDAQWSDGSALTAGDFVYALQRQLDPKSGSGFTWFYSDIKNANPVRNGEMDPSELGVSAPDDHTLVVETEGKVLYLPQVMAYPTSGPVPQAIVEEYGDKWTTDPETALTNSPWKLGSYAEGQEIVLVPNENYVGEHTPFVQEIHFYPSDGNTDFPAYQAGELDGLFADQDTTPVTPSVYKMVKSDPRYNRELYDYPYWCTRYLFFDPNVEPWNDLKVRQAVAHAIDRQQLLDVIYAGLGSPAYGMLPPGFPAYVAGANDEYQQFDLELAQSLLAEAGYPDGQGFPEVELWYKTYEESLTMTGEILQQMLKENLGINVKLQPVEKKVFDSTFAEGGVDFGIQNWEFDYVDPSNFLNVWNPDLGRHQDWNNADFNDLTNNASGEADPDARLQMYEEADGILSSDVGGAFLYHWGHAQMWKEYVRGIPTDASGYKRVPYYFIGFEPIYLTEQE